jgi:hypothetical protein
MKKFQQWTMCGILCAWGLLVLGLAAGCGSDNGDPATDEDVLAGTNTTNTVSSSTNSTSSSTNGTNSVNLAKVNLTGKWMRPMLSSVYSLKHTGASLQGSYYEKNDTNVTGKIAGSVSGVNIEMDVVVTYTDGVRTNFTAHKAGTIKGANHIELKVVSSPLYQGQVQEWYR